MQLTLFRLPDTLPYVPHSATSRAAAYSARECSGAQRQRVLETIRASADGLTDEQGIAASGVSANAYRPRRGELVALGLICDSGRTRPTASGRQATVWECRQEER